MDDVSGAVAVGRDGNGIASKSTERADRTDS